MMKLAAKLSIAAVFAILLAGCENKNSESAQNITIEPGQFVDTEPGVLHGSIKESKKCSLDTINDKQRVPQTGWNLNHGKPIDLQGWAFSEDGKHAAPQVFVQINSAADTYYAVTNNRAARSDANQYLNIDPSLVGGFSLQATTASVQPGIYEIVIMQVFSTGIEACKVSAELTID